MAAPETPGSDQTALAARQARLASNPGTASYGAIVVTASITASASHDDRPWAILAKVASTMGVFWLAHVHSAVVDQRFAAPDQPLGRALKEALLHELVMLEVAVVPLALLVAAGLSWLELDLAVRLALWAGALELFGLGLLRARRAKYGVAATVATGLLYAGAGGLLVFLKSAVH